MKKFINVTDGSIVLNLVVATLVFLSTVVTADTHEADYWSVGTFSTAENAMVEQARLAEMIGLPIQIAVFAEGEMALFRLVIEKDDDPEKQKQMIMESGITPWSIAFDHDQLLEHDSVSAYSTQTPEYFLVLASFQDKVMADALLARFDGSVDAAFRVEESRLGSAAWYRVIHGPFDQPDKSVKAEFNSQGFEGAWWVRREVEESTMTAVTTIADTSPESMDDSATETTTEPMELQLIPPLAGEPYLEYCVEKANQMERTVYCQDGIFGNLIVAERNGTTAGPDALVAGGGVLAEFCTLRATSEERDLYCRN